MNVILLDRVENLGEIGDLVTVKAGYGRNYLIPQGKAALATKANMAEVEARRAELERKVAEETAAAKARAELINGMDLVIAANVGPEGKLFGSVGPADIEEAAEKVGVELARAEVRMADGPLHETGEFRVGAHLYTGVDAEFTVRIVADD